MRTLPLRQETLIREFMVDCDRAGFTGQRQVRTRDQAEIYGCTELRTKKNTHLAVVWDELTNAFALTREGQRLQLTREEFYGK